jgi:NAD(P)H-dependent flavin oxidoreductase YrpB (nitropropane dioxygenase family)
MPPRWNENRLTAKLGIDYPVIQGPLGGLSSQKLTAAVSNFGGLGSFGAHGLAPEVIKDVIAEIRSLTSKPFAMNLWVSTCTDVMTFLTSLVEEISEIAGPIIQWSAARREKQILK